MNKKGQIERGWLYIVFLVLVAISVGIIFGFLSVQSDDSTKQEFYIKDITLLVNRILSSRFKVEDVYKIPEKFSVVITDEEVKIGLEKQVLSKKYIKNKHYKIAYERIGDELTLRRI